MLFIYYISILGVSYVYHRYDVFILNRFISYLWIIINKFLLVYKTMVSKKYYSMNRDHYLQYQKDLYNKNKEEFKERAKNRYNSLSP